VKSGELVKLGVYKCAHFVQNCVKFGEICNLGVLRFWGVRGGPKKGVFSGVFGGVRKSGVFGGFSMWARIRVDLYLSVFLSYFGENGEKVRFLVEICEILFFSVKICGKIFFCVVKIFF